MCWEQHYPKLQNGLKDFIALEIFVSKSCECLVSWTRAHVQRRCVYGFGIFSVMHQLIVLYREDTKTIIMNSVKSVNIKI